jgi:hypothetical protein
MALFFSLLKNYSNSMKKHFSSFTQHLKRVFVNQEGLPQVQAHTVWLSRPEADYVEEQTYQLLRWQKEEALRKRRMGIPPPPTPGRISYAVYM